MRPSASLRILLCCALVACLAMPAGALAYTKGDISKHQAAASAARKKAAAEQAKANQLLADTQALEGQISTIQSDLNALGSKIGSAAQRQAALRSDITLLQSSIAGKQSRIESLTVAYGQRIDALNARVDADYRAGDWGYLEVLLGSQDLGDFIQRAQYVAALVADDSAAANEISASRADLEAASADLSHTLETVQAKSAEIAAEQSNLRQLHSAQDGKRAAVQAVENQKNQLLAETKKNIAHLRAMALAEEQESARIADLLRRGGSHGSGRYAGTLRWPCPGHTNVTSPFGYRMHPILHVRKLHTGIDISAPSGARITAAGSGRVIFAGSNGGYGNFTMIDHGNGLVTCYAHQSRIVVSQGQHVSAGATIGYVGSTGLSTGPHLHFEVRVNGNPVDPTHYL
jgi:murein DD-endopeptidase MepM/ murein hydrolase activator NlpD